MYEIMLLCLFLIPMALSSENNSTDVQPHNDVSERRARDGTYIGCYPQGCLDSDYHAVIGESTTPDTCTATCKENGFHAAILYNRTECACSCEKTCFAKQLDDNLCGLPCRHDLNRFCGGYTAASYYVVKSVNTSNSDCRGKNSVGTINGSSDTSIHSVIAAGIGSAAIIVLIIIFACLRKVVYSPRNHSRRWSAHAPSQENEQRPPNDPHTTINQPRLPPRHTSGTQPSSSVESTSHTRTQRVGEPAIVEDISNNIPVVETNFYHVLTEEDGEEPHSQGLSLATENAYAYADCRSYTDSFPRSPAFIHRQADLPRYPENNEEVEHEMVNNELYAISRK